MNDRDYWKRYYDNDTVRRSEALRSEHRVPSGDVSLHVDVYRQPDDTAPLILVNHGGGGYCRIFVHVALRLFERGYTVVLPDQRGQGYSEGDRGDFVAGDFVANVIDAAHWCRAEFPRARSFAMAGGSVGGALTYAAGAAGAPVDALICHNLYDFGTARDALAVSRLAFLNRIPGAARIATAILRFTARLFPRLRIPFHWLGSFETMVDERDSGFFETWREDPAPIRRVTLRYIASMSATPPAVPFADNRIPVLVLNPVRDRMTHPAVTRRNFERLGGPKQYAELPFGHWSLSPAFADEWCELVDKFLRDTNMQRAGTKAPRVQL